MADRPVIIVCDTNVLISGLLFPGGVPDRIIRLFFSGRLTHATSPDILTEAKRVLQQKMKVPEEKTNRLIRLLADSSRVVFPVERLSVVKGDETDNRVVECAITAKADYLITGDKKHLIPIRQFHGVKITSPAEFMLKTGFF